MSRIKADLSAGVKGLLILWNPNIEIKWIKRIFSTFSAYRVEAIEFRENLKEVIARKFKTKKNKK